MQRFPDLYGSFHQKIWFPAFERFKGRKTLDYWRQFEASQWWSPDLHAQNQLTALQQLLEHAAATSPYYKQTWQAHGLKTEQLQSLADFGRWPLIRRETLLAHRLQMRTTVPGKLIAKSTGGSTGQPVHFDLDQGSHDRRTALMYRGYGWAGGAPGTKQMHIWGGALATVPTWKRWKMRLHARLDRRQVLNCFEFTPAQMRGHLQKINAYRPEVIVAYTTPLYEFARFIEAERLDVWSPHAIIVGAEKLHDFQRTVIERVFHTRVFETYGSREFMLIGAECAEHRGLHLSQENLYVEVLDDDGQPCAAGEEGNVVITDLFNYGMPFIRYVNGDRAVAGWGTCACGRGLPTLRQVVGRRADMIRTPDGRQLTGLFFPHLFKEFPRVQRFQVVQEQLDRIVFKLVAPGISSDDEQQLRHVIQAGVGPRVELAFEYVDEISLTTAGKHRVVISRLPAVLEAETTFAISHRPTEAVIGS